MSGLIDDLLNLLRGHPLVKSIRIVNYDETPAGKLELKFAADLAKNANSKSGYILSLLFKTMPINCLPLVLFCVGIMRHITQPFQLRPIIFIMKMEK